MCLTVDLKKHIHIFNKALPKIALKDIIVYKVVGSRYGYHYSPFQVTPISFTKNKAVLKSRLQLRCYEDSIEVHKGIHAYTKYDIASEETCWHTELFDHVTVYKAVIPRGTKYYLGVDGDIVAKKLIIYK